jgi:hypothetical protein
MFIALSVVACTDPNLADPDHADPDHEHPDDDPADTPASPTAVDPGEEPGTPGLPAWTVAVWMDGDNNLERLLPEDLDELERGVAPGVEVVVQIDRVPGHADGGGDWTGTRRYALVHDDAPGLASPMVADLGEVDMGSGAALAEFLLWAHEEHPAERFALVLWNHGGGFWIASDDTSGSKIRLDDGELTDALAPLNEARGVPLDVIAFDACNMGEWEVAEALSGSARVLAASQAWVDRGGYAYDAVLPSLAEGDLDAVGLGELLARSASDNGELTHAAVDLDALPALSDAIDALSAAFLDDPARIDGFFAARDEARGLDLQWDEFWLDLGTFADAAALDPDPTVASAGAAVRGALDAAVFANYRAAPVSFASGLTIMADTSHPAWFDRYADGPWGWTRWSELLVAAAEAERSAR